MLGDPFRIIAHRGASGYAPENTMAAFRKAAELGVEEVETDVRFTRDGRLLLFHDRTLERTTDGTGQSSGHTLEELKRLDAGSWLDPENYPDFRWDRDYAGEPLITLDELFDEFGDAFVYHVELKDRAPGLVGAVVDTVRRFRLIEHTFVTGIDRSADLLEVKRLEPGIRTALAPMASLRAPPEGTDPAGTHLRGPVQEAARAGHDMVTLGIDSITRELVALGHDLGMEVRSSGIRDRHDIARAARTGCNGMTVNWPDWLQEFVASL